MSRHASLPVDDMSCPLSEARTVLTLLLGMVDEIDASAPACWCKYLTSDMPHSVKKCGTIDSLTHWVKAQVPSTLQPDKKPVDL